MNWDLIPEVFYDIIARVLPGSLFLVGALAVHLGPKEFARVLAESLPTANLAFLLLFLLLAYFAAIVLKVIWDYLTAIAPHKANGDRPLSDPLLSIQERNSSEASGLLKLQAEKAMCEALVPGLSIPLFANVLKIATGASGNLWDRVALSVVFVITGLACWRWRNTLERLYRGNLAILDADERRGEPGEGTS